MMDLMTANYGSGIFVTDFHFFQANFGFVLLDKRNFIKTECTSKRGTFRQQNTTDYVYFI